MIEFTQSSLAPGNCWQTAIACILEVYPDTLPSQVAVETRKYQNHYLNALNAYLEHHHKLVYSEIYEYVIPVLRVVGMDGYHTINGPTVRTPVSRVEHVTVGRFGDVVWDPHPSRAGLVRKERWGILAPQPEKWRVDRDQRRELYLKTEPQFQRKWDRLTYFCSCPECGGLPPDEPDRGDS